MVVIVTGSAGLIGSEAVRFFAAKGHTVVGIDNDMRANFFGKEASTSHSKEILEELVPGYVHFSTDIRNDLINDLFAQYNTDIGLIIHTAAQPSHDWAATDPSTDFSVNAVGTLNLLEAARKQCPDAVFIFTSTNKVYGDRPNQLPLVELETRWELPEGHELWNGIDESMSIDGCLHSLFGVSKASADLMVQEYGRYFGMKTGVFRGGCLTGSGHAGTMLHGFLSYLVKCAKEDLEYKILGYKGKQVRDNIHSYDLVNSFYHFFRNPRPGAVYNMGGSRYSNCSIIEAVKICEKYTGQPMKTTYVDEPRIGDHKWYISDVSKFDRDYPEWNYTYIIEDIMMDLFMN